MASLWIDLSLSSSGNCCYAYLKSFSFSSINKALITCIKGQIMLCVALLLKYLKILRLCYLEYNVEFEWLYIFSLRILDKFIKFADGFAQL
jgi:hypothetical protein